MNHLTEEQLVLYHYGDAAGRDAVERHLRECAACEADLDQVRLTLSTVESLDVPERGEEYGPAVWARLQPSLGQDPPGWRARLAAVFAPRRLAWAGAAAALLAVAFVAGRQVAWQRPVTGRAPASAESRQAPEAATAAARQPVTGVSPGRTAAPARPGAAPMTAADREGVQAGVLLVAVGDHLERSQMALSELVNSDAGPEIDISSEQERARDLLTENRLYRQTAAATGEPAVVSVLDDLERVLVEVANGPSRLDAAEFDRVRQRIDRQGIIFKVRVFGERVREAKGESRPIVRTGSRG